MAMDMEKIRDYRNRANAFGIQLGIYIEEIRENYARATKVVREGETNPAGTGHGGICFTMADAVAAAASSATGHASATVNADYQYLHSCYVGDTLTAVASEVKHGRTLCVYEVRITNQEDKLIGIGTFTFFIKDKMLPL